MKKFFGILLILLMILASANAEEVRLGVHIYKFGDTFMTSVTKVIRAEAAKSMDCHIYIEDGMNSQATQTDNISAQINSGIDGLAINPVDLSASALLLKKAKSLNIPLVFFNREPDSADMPSEGWYYVGAKAEESGTMSGEILADYFKNHPEADKNGDGIIQYVIFVGEMGHQDASLRTEYSVKALKNSGFGVEELESYSAMWNKGPAQDKMQLWLGSFGDKIEAVLANNDDMALGAIEALKSAGYFVGDKFMPVVGVDATAPALQALKEGSLLGTVLNDSKNIGNATFRLLYLLSKGIQINKDNFKYEITDNCYVWIPYQKVSRENYKDFE